MRCVIIGGAPVSEYEEIKSHIKNDDFIICCDSGLYHASKLGVTPGLIVGDFDSHPTPKTETETIVLPRQKDDTDSMYAVKEALTRGYDEFLFIGVCGGRLDHTFANLSILLKLYNEGKSAVILDDFSQMLIVGSKTEVIGREYSYFSLVNINGDAGGVTVSGALYPLKNAQMRSDSQYAISNEVTGEYAEVFVNEGCMLLIMVR